MIYLNQDSCDSGLDVDLNMESMYTTIDLSDPAILSSLTKGDMIDPTLAGLAVSAVQTGDITPLIKEELKCTIQKRRLQTGKEELDLTEICEPKSKKEKISPEEEDKRRKRREKNKLAAQKCRSRRKDTGDKLEKEVNQLEKANQQIEDEIESLEKEKEQLRLMLLSHDSKIQHCPQRARLSESDVFSDTVSVSDALSETFYDNEDEVQEYLKNIPEGEQVIEIELVEDDGSFALLEGAEIIAFQA